MTHAYTHPPSPPKWNSTHTQHTRTHIPTRAPAQIKVAMLDSAHDTIQSLKAELGDLQVTSECRRGGGEEQPELGFASVSVRVAAV